MTRLGATEAKALARGEFDDKGRRLEDRRRLETVVVLAVNDADAVVPFCMATRKRNRVGPWGEYARKREI